MNKFIIVKFIKYLHLSLHSKEFMMTTINAQKNEKIISKEKELFFTKRNDILYKLLPQIINWYKKKVIYL